MGNKHFTNYCVVNVYDGTHVVVQRESSMTQARKQRDTYREAGYESYLVKESVHKSGRTKYERIGEH